jgi:transcription initiation factor TFIID subunit 1
MPSSINSFSA